MADGLPHLLGESPAFADLLDRVSAAAPLDRPVLVIGERGTGKELIAARLHFLSPRWDRPFVKLDCAALSPELLESELFGHEAGAFTGAVRRHVGRFERADRGTLFLDELANAGLRVQEKLLRVIEYGEIERVGGTQTMTVDVRVVAATNVDLPGEVAAGRFRGDLLDRLAFDVLTVPPLRARPEDIPLLAGHFAQAMAHALDRPGFPGFAPAAAAALRGHPWPGNIRELKNAVERAVYRTPPGDPVTEIVLDPFASPWRPKGLQTGAGAPRPASATPALPYDFRAEIAAVEKRWLEAALQAHGGHQGRAATALGLGYDQLRHLLRKHGMSARSGGDDA
ncbi:phage shock protein operon transcriptional activator [Mycobacterium sp. KBS0706]|uniref:phage shock protein operon transcriptional activator n=1 Tax=Mycobacterium sp. KBS0706 TaxID=2578109 RepID=UPI00110F8F48|nr:phage shock protein operon transcriptional activator [Mycobacterium sp. KBS0706]TSD83788.1 phage shock protein operon transcriptional activator [Mycobacterium sp. KBS0706]